MDKLNLSLGTQQQPLSLSESRVKHFLDGNAQAGKRMGWFDSLKDTLFHGGAKQAALTDLAQKFEDAKGTNAFDHFTLLARYALPVDRSQFTVQVSGEQATPNLEYRIKGTTVKLDTVQAADWNNIQARLGRVTGLDGLDVHAADWLSQHVRTEFKDKEGKNLRKILTDQAFNEGGVHKRFNPGTGVLRAEDKTGEADFTREKKIAGIADGTLRPDGKPYANDEPHSGPKPALERYISTQRELSNLEKAKELPAIESKKAHALVTLYDPAHVESGEMDRKIDTLTPREAHSVLMQTIDMARVFYQTDISHQDLHMHNLMLYKPTDPTQTNITLKAIDFGKSKVGVTSESDRLNDVRYLFQKQASSGQLETFKRNVIRGADDASQQKHYPLHKLLAQCAQTQLSSGQFDATLQQTGDRLIANLRHAATRTVEQDRTDSVDRAFNLAMQEVSAITDHLITRPEVNLPAHYQRV